HYHCALARGGPMKRREFIGWFSAWLGTWLGGGAVAFSVLGSTASRAQNAAANQAGSAAGANSIGQVASMTRSATGTRRKASRAALKVADAVYANDILQTELNSSVGVTFDDETTFQSFRQYQDHDRFIRLSAGWPWQSCLLQCGDRDCVIHREPGRQDRRYEN